MELSNAFRVFKCRNYSLFFTGQLISRLGVWMQRTAIIWVIYKMTNSILMVGLATFVEQFPSFLLSPIGGIVADRYNRYKILLITQIISALQAILLTIIYFSGFGSLEILLLLGLILGIINAFDVPIRQTMVNDLINDSNKLPSAIAMNSSLNNLTRLVGPALAGILLAKYGATICFGFNAVSFIAVILCISFIKLPKQEIINSKENIWENLHEGWQYLIKQSDIKNPILLSVLVYMLVTTYNTLQPHFAENVFNGGSVFYGYINAATGLGALISTLFIASQKNSAYLKQLLFFNLILLGLGLVIMSFIHIFSLYLLLAAICGFGIMSTMPICNTIIQTVSSSQMRGRVIGFFTMATLGALPLGSLLIGWITKFVSVELCQAGQGFLCLLIATSFYRYFKR